MRSTSGLVLSMFLVVLAMSAGEVRALEGRTLIWGAPYTITAPGHYVLAANINITTGSAITVSSDCVELNLDGKSIRFTGTPTVGDHLIEINGGTDVTIYNGWLTGGYRGINYTSVGGSTARVRIRDVEIREATNLGIFIGQAESVELVGNQVHLVSGAYAIYVDAAASIGSFTGRIVDNTVQNVSGHGIYLRGFEGGDVIRNVVRWFGTAVQGTDGIRLDGFPGNVGGNVIRENTISFGGDDGLVILSDSRNNRIEGNVLYENANRGLYISSEGNKVKNNTIGNNGGDGIQLVSPADRNMIDNNHIENNSGWGIRFSNANNVCRDNTVQGNVSGTWTGGAQINLGGNFPVTLCGP